MWTLAIVILYFLPAFGAELKSVSNQIDIQVGGSRLSSTSARRNSEMGLIYSRKIKNATWLAVGYTDSGWPVSENNFETNLNLRSRSHFARLRIFRSENFYLAAGLNYRVYNGTQTVNQIDYEAERTTFGGDLGAASQWSHENFQFGITWVRLFMPFREWGNDIPDRENDDSADWLLSLFSDDRSKWEKEARGNEWQLLHFYVGYAF